MVFNTKAWFYNRFSELITPMYNFILNYFGRKNEKGGLRNLVMWHQRGSNDTSIKYMHIKTAHPKGVDGMFRYNLQFHSHIDMMIGDIIYGGYVHRNRLRWQQAKPSYRQPDISQQKAYISSDGYLTLRLKVKTSFYYTTCRVDSLLCANGVHYDVLEVVLSANDTI